MIFGEHSVLRKGPAVVAAVDRWLSVEIEPRNDDQIHICSSLGESSTTLENICLDHTFRFVSAALHTVLPPSGCSITICSQIDPTMGLGSSASVTVALLAALLTWKYGSFTKENLLLLGTRTVQAVQGRGSGADIASIVYGGVISFTKDPLQATFLCPTLPIICAYSGHKTPTPTVIDYVHEREKQHPELFSTIFTAIDQVTHSAIAAIQTQDLALVGRLMNTADGLMQALGVGTAALSDICWHFRQRPTIYGAKISGSGLGDCAIGLGEHPEHKIEITPEGVCASCQ